MITTKLFFSEHPVNLINISEKEVHFECKGVIGSLSQINLFLNDRKLKKQKTKDYYFGNVKFVEHENERLQMDCLENGTIKEAQALADYGNELISDSVINEELAYKIVDILENNDDTTSDTLDNFRNKVEQKLKLKNQTFSIRYYIKGFEKEILVALFQAMTDIYGNANFMETEKGASGDLDPVIVKVDLPNGTKINVPMGKLRLPGFSKHAYIDTNYDNSSFCLIIKGSIQSKFQNKIDEIVAKTQENLNNNSMYKNTLINIPFHDNYSYPVSEPTFIDVSGLVRQKPLILSQQVKSGLLNIIGRIKDPTGCLEDGIDVKSTFLLSGIGGTGKTETMFREITPIALAEGMTVLYINKAKHYAKLLEIAAILYSRGWKVLIIIEDIDQAFEGDQRGDLQQDILNTLDGGHNKEMNLISLLTTNYEEKLNPFFVRRITDIIHFAGMDIDGAEEFVNVYIPEKYLDKTNKDEYIPVYNALVDIVPSLAKRIVDKTLVIRRAKNSDSPLIKASDIMSAITSFKHQEGLSVSKLYASKEESIQHSMANIFKVVGLSKNNMKMINENTYRGHDNDVALEE